VSGARPSVFIIDDDPSVLRATQRVMRAAGLEACAFSSAREFLDAYDPYAPGCLLLDLAMPGLSGLELQQALVARGGAPAIVFMSGNADVPASVEAMKGGAVEFLVKPVDAAQLIGAVRTAMEKDRVQRDARAGRQQVERRMATLTPREAQVMRCVVTGKLNKQIAAELGAAEKTIKVHRARVMRKMEVGSVAELVQAAARVGIA
jgi:FixJ family two-component response regulator